MKVITASAGNAPKLDAIPDAFPESTPFCGFADLCNRLPFYSARTLRSMVAKRIIPAVRPPGSRKLAFFWPGVVEALRRHQTIPV